MKNITAANIDDFIREARRQGLTKLAWTEKDWKILELFALANGDIVPFVSGRSLMTVQHYLIKDEELS